MKRKAIAVVSGKGGVGKTSITASLASLANKDAKINPIVIDCDVDAPNLALILPEKTDDVKNIKDVFATLKCSFLEEKCVHCIQCITDHYCEFKALTWDKYDEVPIIDFLACEGCGACKVLCPEHAFEIHPVKSGEIISYNTSTGIPLIYGKTNLGSTTSGKLVSDTKEQVKTLKEFSNCNLIIIDGPPGIGCPVIATISGLDFIITITEPTPSGLHDLIRVIEVVQQFKIPFGIIINKFDLDSPFQAEFKEFIKVTGYNIIGKIPYDLSIPKAMSFAETIVDYDSQSRASIAIENIYINLKEELWNNTN